MKSRPESHCAGRAAPGFSLIELLLVITIGAILLALSAPLAFHAYQQQLVVDTSKQLEDTLDLARSYAVANLADAPHGVRLQTSQKRYILFQGESFATRNTAEDQIFTYPESVSITASTPEAVFSRLYGTSTINQVWQIQADGFARNLRIRRSGNVERE